MDDCVGDCGCARSLCWSGSRRELTVPLETWLGSGGGVTADRVHELVALLAAQRSASASDCPKFTSLRFRENCDMLVHLVALSLVLPVEATR
jgi:hypothetical protein